MVYQQSTLTRCSPPSLPPTKNTHTTYHSALQLLPNLQFANGLFAAAVLAKRLALAPLFCCGCCGDLSRHLLCHCLCFCFCACSHPGNHTAVLAGGEGCMAHTGWLGAAGSGPVVRGQTRVWSKLPQEDNIFEREWWRVRACKRIAMRNADCGVK